MDCSARAANSSGERHFFAPRPFEAAKKLATELSEGPVPALFRPEEFFLYDCCCPLDLATNVPEKKLPWSFFPVVAVVLVVVVAVDGGTEAAAAAAAAAMAKSLLVSEDFNLFMSSACIVAVLKPLSLVAVPACAAAVAAPLPLSVRRLSKAATNCCCRICSARKTPLRACANKKKKGRICHAKTDIQLIIMKSICLLA